MALDDRETPQTGEVSEVNPREDRSSNGWNERTRIPSVRAFGPVYFKINQDLK